MPEKTTRLSSGVVVVRQTESGWSYILLRAFKHWDFPKGMVEPNEAPLAAAIREVEEETLIKDLRFSWGEEFIETGPYSRNKVARYYLAETSTVSITLPFSEVLGRPEHNEFRWVNYGSARELISVRLMPVLKWAQARLARALA